MRKIVRIHPTAQGGTLEVRVYGSYADRQRALTQMKHRMYTVSFQDVQGPAIQLIKEG